MNGFAQVPKSFYTDGSLSPLGRLIGVSIIGFQFQDGVTRVGQEAIAKQIGLSVRHTRRGLNELEAAKWVEVEHRPKVAGKWQTNLYSFNFHRGTSLYSGEHHGPSLSHGQGWPTTNKEDLNKGGHDMSSGDAVAVLATPASNLVNTSSSPSGHFQESPRRRTSSSYGEVPGSHDVVPTPPEEDDDCEQCRDPEYFHPLDQCPPSDRQWEAYQAWLEVGRPPLQSAGQPLWCAVCGGRKEFKESSNRIYPSPWHCPNWKDGRHRGKRSKDV